MCIILKKASKATKRLIELLFMHIQKYISDIEKQKAESFKENESLFTVQG